MVRTSLSQSIIPEPLKILTYDGYWSRVMFYKSQKTLTHRKIWTIMENDLAKLGSYKYQTFISFKKNLYSYINKQEVAADELDRIDLDPRLFSYDGYWEQVMEIRKENESLTREKVWRMMEDRLDRFGLRRYISFSSYKTEFSRYIVKQLKK